MRQWLLGVILGLCATLSSSLAGERPFFADASIHDIQFVDASEGWAVGDDGVIWHTFDAGLTWERQASGVQASLRSLHFVTPYSGWVVGRQALPDGSSVGVILQTTDGGLKWSRASLNALPGLNDVHFFDATTGFVLGDSSAAFASGVFLTRDGGTNWRSVPGPREPGWTGGTFRDSKTGIVAGPWGKLATLRDDQFRAADVDDLGGRGIQAVHQRGSWAIAVGQGGLILISADSSGLRWGFADPGLPQSVLACCDFQDVCVLDDHVWVVGQPGSIVLHSPDRGKTWETLKTGQHLPLRAVHFATPTHGWACGELGTILATSDGGKTWTIQQQGGQRAAILCVHGQAHTIPVEAIAHYGQQQGYLTTAVQLTSADPALAKPQAAFAEARLAGALREIGGAAAWQSWQFPLDANLHRMDAAILTRHWNRLHANRFAEEMLRQMVLALRTWRPEVVVTDGPSNGRADILDGILAEGMLEAFRRAADPQAFPEQITQLGLQPWAAKKLYGRVAQAKDAHLNVDWTQSHPRGGSPRELARPAAWLLGQSSFGADQGHFRLLATRVKDAHSHRDLMEGIALAAGGTARRTFTPLTEADAAAQQQIQAAQKLQQNLEKLCRMARQPEFAKLARPEQVMGQYGKVLKQLPEERGARAAYSLATALARQGQWHLARELYLLMVDRYPAHPLAAEAYRWLVQYHSSSEARRRHELRQFVRWDDGAIRGVAPNDNPASGTEILQSSQKKLFNVQNESRAWYQGSLAVESRLAAYGPLFALDPRVQLSLQSARRQLNQFDAARKWYQRYLDATAAATGDRELGTGRNPWRDAIAAELWLAERKELPRLPKPVYYGRQTAQRPRLDGQLNDACWQGLAPMRLQAANGDLGEGVETAARFAFDDQHLYIAVECAHPEHPPTPKAKQRQHDDDLRAHDRISILLDLDRDYQTYFHLQVDERGCLAEDCWGDAAWNPKWFVAVDSTPTKWTVEIAIPTKELLEGGIKPGSIWAANVSRTVPGDGVQAWSIPTGTEPRPEGMGLVQFIASP